MGGIMCDRLLTVIVLGRKKSFAIPKFVDVLFYDAGDNLLDVVNKTDSKYIAFVDCEDTLDRRYFSVIHEKVNEEFDLCFINNAFIGASNKILKNSSVLAGNELKEYDYLWNYIFNRERFVQALLLDGEDYSKKVSLLFKNRAVISDVIYFHNRVGEIYEIPFFCNRKEEVSFDNIVYVGTYCCGTFNGYISWLINIGKSFSDKHNICVVYDKIIPVTLARFNEYFDCFEYSNQFLFSCSNLICTYSTYFYPHNIVYSGESLMFIHGLMSDYPNACHFSDDIYDRYVAVSKIASLKAKGYFPTDNIEAILNPYVLEKEAVRPHLKLVSAQRSAAGKGLDKIDKFAKILDALEIPYTWNCFTDKYQGTNRGGLIYRQPVTNVVDYVQDADYVVLLSNSESFAYTLIEGLVSRVKVITTPLEICSELKIVDGENGFIVPFEYFNDGNEDKLAAKIMEIYKNKDRNFEYEYGPAFYQEYNTVFK